MQYKTQCIICGQEIVGNRKYPIAKSQLNCIKKYCPSCKHKRLINKPAAHRRKELRYLDSSGYIKVLNGNIHVLEHRYLMELSLGTQLRKGEIVHHIDGNKINNDIKNLELIDSKSFHSRLHIMKKNPRHKKLSASLALGDKE